MALRRAGCIAALVSIGLVFAGCEAARPSRTPPSPPPVATPSVASLAPSLEPSTGPSVVPEITDAPGAIDQTAEAEDATVVADRPEIMYRGPEAWQIQDPSTVDRFTYAYADAPSYLPGQTLRLAVSTTSPAYVVSVFRMGAGIEPMGGPSKAQPGTKQASPSIDAATKMARAPWRYTYSQVIPSSWPSGLYLAKVSGEGGPQGYVPFVIRSASRTRFLFVTNFLDQVAYNRWGGSSLYWTQVGDPAPGQSRAFAASLDRPFDDESGAGEIFMLEAPFIAWLERSGYDVSYTTDYDLSVHPSDQPVPGAVLFAGHSEYWGLPLRDWLDQHVLQAGDMGLGLFAADSGYWRVRVRDDTATGPRTAVVYKNSTFDPDIRKACPGGYSRYAEEFRSLPCGLVGPGNRPEQALFGVQYGEIVPGFHPYLLAGSATPSLLVGTGLQPGDSIGDVVGGEVDRVFTTVPNATGDTLFAQANNLATRSGPTTHADAVVRALPSGGRVFSSGTFWWGWGLEPHFAAARNVAPGFAQLTANILAFLAAG